MRSESEHASESDQRNLYGTDSHDVQLPDQPQLIIRMDDNYFLRAPSGVPFNLICVILIHDLNLTYLTISTPFTKSDHTVLVQLLKLLIGFQKQDNVTDFGVTVRLKPFGMHHQVGYTARQPCTKPHLKDFVVLFNYHA